MSDEGKLFIGGLSFETNEDSLAAAFGKYGTIEKGQFYQQKNKTNYECLPDGSRFVLVFMPCGFIQLKISRLFFCLISVDVIRDKETGRSRGFGFVKYNNAEDAKDAMTAMDGKVVTEQLCT